MRGSGDDGVILFSFGSYMRGMKKEQAESFLAAFSRLKQRIVMKYKEEESLPLPENTIVSKWLPQNDILGKFSYVFHRWIVRKRSLYSLFQLLTIETP